ncbi:sugar phosphate nucleotidyltransferase [soil metagenome]
MTVAGKTLIDHVLDRLVVLEPEKVVFITGYLGDQIEEHVKSTYEFESVFVEQPEMLGQSHAILQAKDAISGPILVLFPDMLFEADLSIAKETDADGILWVREVDDPSRFGVVVKDGDRVSKLVEKPDEPVSNLAVMGIYYFKDAAVLIDAIERQIADENITKGEYFIADAMQMMINDGAHFATSEATVWQDAGTNEALLETNRYLLDLSDSAVSNGQVLVIPPALIDPSADVRESIIGPHASIGPGAVVNRSIVRDSIIDVNAQIDDANIDHSIVGRDAVVRGTPARINIGDTSEVELAESVDRG